MDPKFFALLSGAISIVGGVGCVALSLVFPPAAAAAAQLIPAGIGLVTVGTGIIAASNSGPAPKPGDK